MAQIKLNILDAREISLNYNNDYQFEIGSGNGKKIRATVGCKRGEIHLRFLDQPGNEVIPNGLIKMSSGEVAFVDNQVAYSVQVSNQRRQPADVVILLAFDT